MELLYILAMAKPSNLLEAPYHHNTHSTPSSLPEILGVLQYNQGLVEFADSKSGSLILLNSLLIAAVTALPNTAGIGILKVVSVLVASCAVYFCFQVISSTAGNNEESNGPIVKKKSYGWEANDFIFFGTISNYKNADDYCRAYASSDPNARCHALLQRSYIVAEIAKRKFSQYAVAQKVTTLAMAVWVVVTIIPFLQ